MPISVCAAFTVENSQYLDVQRETGGRYDNGVWIAGSTVSIKVLCSVQQPTPSELKMLPEGERRTDVLKFFTKKILFRMDERDENDQPTGGADFITYKGLRYKIVKIENWGDYGYNVGYGVRDEG